MSSEKNIQKFETFGAWLRHWRDQFELTQEQLGERVGVSKQQISNLERGLRDPKTGKVIVPSIELANKLARIFKQPISEVYGLMSGTEQEVPEMIEDEIEERVKNLDDRGLLKQQIIHLNTIFMSIPAEKRTQVLEFVELLQAGYAARSFSKMIGGKVEILGLVGPDEIDDDEKDETQPEEIPSSRTN